MDKLESEFSRMFSPENPVFTGGFGLAVLAAGAQVLRHSYQISITLLRRHFLMTLEVTSKDRAYPWVLQWLTAKGTTTQHLSVETSIKARNNGASVAFDLVPGPGQHLMNYKGKFMLVQRVREQQMPDLNSGKPWEKVVFTSVGRDTSYFQEILADSYNLSVHQEEGKTIIYSNWGSEWRQFGQPRRKRSIESVVLDDSVATNLLKDIEEWISSSQWYNDRGIPYRRGYLLHGPPGSGKSSFIYALAGKLNYNICVLNLSERGLTDDRLALALSCVPPQSIVLLEDIDAAFPNREAEESTNHYKGSEVTFSGLLNVLDGVSASEERLIFMTTNHINRLDPALIRPGRVDYSQLIDNATDYQVIKLFLKFYHEANEETAKIFLQLLREKIGVISMASLQGYFLRNKESASVAIQNIQVLLDDIQDRHTDTKSTKSEDKPKTNVANKSQPIKSRPVKPLTVDQVDKMFFNPQPDWDKGLHEIK